MDLSVVNRKATYSRKRKGATRMKMENLCQVSSNSYDYALILSEGSKNGADKREKQNGETRKSDTKVAKSVRLKKLGETRDQQVVIYSSRGSFYSVQSCFKSWNMYPWPTHNHFKLYQLYLVTPK